MLLECVRCLRDYEWNKDKCPEGPGLCSCGTYISDPWRVIKKRRALPRGHVRVLENDGWRELKPL